MAGVRKYEYIVPRSFRLRSELEFAEKGTNSIESKSNANKQKDLHQGFVSYGLGDLEENPAYDHQLSNWNGTIIGPQNTPLGERIYMVKLKCGPSYPNDPPRVQFSTKIIMSGVDQTNGLVNYTTVTGKSWNRSVTMYDYLCRLREAMVNAAKTKQPNPEETFAN